MDGKTAAALALEGVDKSRFPFTCAAVARKERAAGAMGMSFAQMREELTVEAAMEPQLNERCSHNSNGGGDNSSNGGAKGATNDRHLRINALQQQLKALKEGNEEEGANESVGMAPAPIAAGSNREHRDRCSKCGAEGHVTPDCSSETELRRCHRCRRPGHLIADCQQQRKSAQKQGKDKGEAQGQGTAGGAPAPEAAGGEPIPKNE
jgi:hypothetical protein